MGSATALVGIPWYRREDYARIRELMRDPLPADYDSWLNPLETHVKALEVQGTSVVRAVIDPEPFASWCKRLRIVPDDRARQAFANEEAFRWYLEQS